jgi:hypothetical protein
MAKTQILEYEIHLNDAALVATLNGFIAAGNAAPYPAGVGAILAYKGTIRGILRAPTGAAVEFGSIAEVGDLPLINTGTAAPASGNYVTSQWFTGSSDFPRDVQQFTKSNGWWIFGGNTKFYWAGRFVYTAAAEGNGNNGTRDTEPAPIRNRYWLNGFESVKAGAGVAAESATSISLIGGRLGDSYALLHSASTSGVKSVQIATTGINPTSVWERFRFCVEDRLPDVAVEVWRSNHAAQAAAGYSIDLTASGQFAFYSIDASSVRTLISTAGPGITGTFTIGTRYLLDLVGAISQGTSPQAWALDVYINHVLVASLSISVAGSPSLFYVSQSRLGLVQAITSTGRYSVDDWVAAPPPYPLDLNLTAWDVGTPYTTGQIVRRTGSAYKAVQNSTGQDPATDTSSTYWKLLTLPSDFLNGSIVRLARPNGLASAFANWVGDYRLATQRPVMSTISNAELTSTTSGATAAFTTDLAEIEALPGVIGWVSFVVNAFQRRGSVANGTLGYKLGAAAPVLSAITQTTGLQWNVAKYAPASELTTPQKGIALEVHHVKGAEVNAAGLAVMHAEVELVGVFEECDIPAAAQAEDNIPPPPDQHNRLHNAPYPLCPWVTATAPFGPVILETGTYVGNGTGQDLAFPAPVLFFFTRPTTSDAGGAFWWSACAGGHRGIEQGIGGTAGLFGQPKQDLTFVSGGASDDQQMRFVYRLVGANGQANQNAITYAYFAIMDPAARFFRSGALQAAPNMVPFTQALESEFTAEVGLSFKEEYSSTSTAACYYKGPGYGVDEIGLLSTGTAIANALTFAANQLIARAGLITSESFVDYPFFLIRRDDGNDIDASRVVQIGSYTGDGAASRTISMAPASGRRPMWGVVVPHNSVALRRDPSHTGTNSHQVSNGAVITTGITGGGLDAFTVGVSLNSNGIVYDYLMFPGSATAGNGGWSIAGQQVPVASDSPGDSDWTEPEELLDDEDEEAEPNPLDPGDLDTDIDADCVAASTRLCNLALSEAGITVQLSSLATDQSQEGFTCRLVYKTIVDQVLRAYAWNFARTKSAALTLVGGTSSDPVDPDWGYSYALPSNCLRVLRVLDPIGGRRRQTISKPIPFQVQQDDTPRDVLYTNEPEEVHQASDPIRVEYIRRVPCPGRVTDAVFRQCLVYRLAAAIAKPLGKDDKDADRLLAKYRDLLPQDKVLHANEQDWQRPTDTDPDWITGR